MEHQLSEWRPVVGYEGRYEVSDHGDVHSLSYRRTGRRKALIQFPDSWGYFAVQLLDGGGKRTVKTIGVHRLVARAFIGPKPSNMEINHIDGNKNNNHYSNLEYITEIENMKHSIVNKLHGRSKLSEDQAFTIKTLYASGVKSKELARRFAVHQTSIQRVVNGRTRLFCREGG